MEQLVLIWEVLVNCGYTVVRGQIMMNELHGTWWASENSKQTGRLIRRDDKNYELIIHKPLVINDSDWDESLTIYGQTQEGEVTLLNCFKINSTIEINQVASQLHKYFAKTVLIGSHVSSDELRCFDGVLFEVSLAEFWFDPKFLRSTVKSNHDWQIGSLSDFSLFVNLKDQGSIIISKTYKIGAKIDQLNVCPVVQFYFRSRSPRSLVELNQTMWKISNFISICVGHRCFPLQIRPYSSGGEWRVYSNKIKKQTDTTNLRRNEIIRYSTFGERTVSILQNWVNAYKIHEVSLNLLVNNLANRSHFDQERFLDAVRVLETYGSERLSISMIDELKYRTLVNHIISFGDLTGEERGLLKQKLKYFNRGTLRQKLIHLIEIINGELERELQNKEIKIACHRIVNARNYFTHFTKELKKYRLEGQELIRLTKKVEAIGLYFALREIGLEPKEAYEYCVLRNHTTSIL